MRMQRAIIPNALCIKTILSKCEEKDDLQIKATPP